MTHIHYKFSSKLSSDTVIFDGPHITLRELKRQIMGREKLRSGDCDLQITNAQTKEEYTDDEGMIPKGSSVIVRRIPIVGVKSSSNSKTRNIERSGFQLHHTFGAFNAMIDQSSSRALPLFSKMANLAVVDVSEEDKLKVILNQSTYDSMNYTKFGAGLPANYTCYRCGNTGHHIRNCPTSGVRADHDKNSEAPLRLKKSTGIPRSFMVEVDDPNIKGAMLTNCGHYAIPAMHAKAYAVGKKEKPPFVPQEQPTSEDEDPVPNELVCMICHELLSDAVVIPCCGNSFCDDCIRTALLDSDQHICPTCSQSDVSPDTLIANKFLRQAVNTFQKERSHPKSLRGRCGTSQSQNPTWAPSPVPTPPPLAMQRQSTHSQQDPLLHCSQAADTASSSQVSGAPPTATGPASSSNVPSASLQPEQSHQEITDKEAEEKTDDDSAAAAPSEPVPHQDDDDDDNNKDDNNDDNNDNDNKDDDDDDDNNNDDNAAAASQVTDTAAVEQPQTVSVTLQQSSSDSAPRHPGPSTSWDSCPTGGWSKSNMPSSSSSSYPAAPPPLFPSPHLRPFLPAQQPLKSYPPGYPPATPVWTLQTPQGAPIPSLCSSTTEWYMHQRGKNERSPHRGSTYRRSSSRSNSKSLKSKSSRSYSRSSSRSRSRSRSLSRSRPQSPYSHHRDHHTRSHSSYSYSYGYKRSPTPSSSSSPRLGYRSRSKSPSDHRKKSHHSRHHSKKSASSRYSSRRRGESPQRGAGGSEKSLASYLYAQHAEQNNSVELDRQRYLQWKREYKEWCEKYFNSYVSHFHQLPPSLLNLNPTPLAQWGDKEGNAESHNRLHGRRVAQMDDRSPPSQSSSDSRSTPSHSSSDSRSSPSHSSNDSRSPPSHSSSDGRSTPSEPRAYQHRCAEKYNRRPITLTKGSKDAELQVRTKDDKQLISKKVENLSTSKYKQRSMKKAEERRGEESSSPDAADSMDDCRKDQRRHNTGPNACKDGTLLQEKATASEALESAQPLVKPDKHLDKDYERKGRQQRNLEIEKGWGRGQYSDSRHDAERRHKEKPSKGGGRVDTDRYRNPGGSDATELRSEKTQKRKGEDVERRSVEAQSSKCLKTNISEVPQTCKSETQNPKTEKKKERKTRPLTESDIWEGGIKVKSQKRISININLPCLERSAGKTKEEIGKTNNGEEEKLNREGTDVNENKESSRDQEGESKKIIKPDERKASPIWEKATSSDHKGQMREKTAGVKEDFDLWHCVLRGREEEKESKKQWEEHGGMKASDKEETTNNESMKGGKEEEGGVRNDGGGQEVGELAAGTQKEELMEEVKKEETTSKSHQDGPNTTVDDGSHEDRQERKMVVKSLEEYTQDGAADREDELILIKVPHSKWEKEESEDKEQDEGVIKVQTDALTVGLPSSSVSVTAETPTNRETEGENDQQRHGEIERDRAMDRGPETKESNSTVSSAHRSATPSSGKDRPDSTFSTRERERRMDMERSKDGERGRESERPRDRQKESRRSKERTRGEEKGRDRERERGHSSKASVRKRNCPSSSHSYSMPHDTERRDRQRGDDQGSNKSPCCPGGKSSSGRSWESGTMSRAAELPAHKMYRGMLLDLKIKDKDHSHYYHNPQAQSGNYRHKDRPAGTHHSPPSLPQSRTKGRGRMSSPAQEFMQSRSRNESKVEKEEWKQKRVDEVIKEGKWQRDDQDVLAENKRGGQWEGEPDKLDGQTKWELEEGERPSSSSSSSSSKSSSSSASQESSSDDGRKEWKKKQKMHKMEKRQAAPELLEEGELKKNKYKKKSKRSRDGGE